MLTLSDAIANAYLFAGDAKTDSKGLVQIWIGALGATFLSYDDYIYLEQYVEFSEPGDIVSAFFVEKKRLKEVGDDGFHDLRDEPQTGPDALFEDLRASLWDFPSADLRGFTFPSDRFGKISRIKGDEPCIIELGMDQGMKLEKFTKGPSVQGMMAFLEEE